MRERAILMAATLLAGCSLAPPHERPALPTAGAYPGNPAGGVIRAVDLDWRDFIVDPRLEVLVGQALERNRDLAQSVARIEEARGQYRIQNAERLPQIDGTAGFTRSRSNTASFGGAAGGVGGGTGTGTGGVTSFTFNRYDIGVGVSSFELDFWGRVRNLSEAARAQYLSTVQAERAFRLSLIRDVSSTYFASREAAERVALAERTVTSRREGVRIAKRRLDAGVTSALDYRQAETLLTQAETELASLRLTQAQTDNALSVLVGGPITTPLPDPLRLDAQQLQRALDPGLPSELMTNRPDILSAEETLRAARANIGAARAAFFPSISLTGSAGFASNQLDGLFTNDTLTWSFGPAIRLPIFDGGALRGNLTVARARENIAVAAYEKAVQVAFQEVADTLAGRRWLADQVAAQQRAVVAQRSLARLARLRYQNGVAQYLEVLDAERNLFDAEQALIQLHRADADNLVAFYVALGGGLSGPAAP
ncbi:efflux transporter outer membrane subunit [Sphingomonas sp. 1P06PA]|uniref:efflux transporter outer membrane subunit n=1 Tax=Sphingomonas sp. 1P06PA TaxID=554121 RepID=UPI0039A513FF